jgi:hypothetical protein
MTLCVMRLNTMTLNTSLKSALYIIKKIDVECYAECSLWLVLARCVSYAECLYTECYMLGVIYGECRVLSVYIRSVVC